MFKNPLILISAAILLLVVYMTAMNVSSTPQERKEATYREESIESIVSETMIISSSKWESIGRDTSIKRVEFNDAICYVSKGINSGGIGCIRKVHVNEK